MKEYTHKEICEVIKDLVELKNGNGKSMSVDKISDCLNYCAFVVLQRETVLQTIQKDEEILHYIKGLFE